MCEGSASPRLRLDHGERATPPPASAGPIEVAQSLTICSSPDPAKYRLRGQHVSRNRDRKPAGFLSFQSLTDVTKRWQRRCSSERQSSNTLQSFHVPVKPNLGEGHRS